MSLLSSVFAAFSPQHLPHDEEKDGVESVENMITFDAFINIFLIL